MTRAFRTWLARYRFNRATRAFDRKIAEARAKHGRVRDAEAEKAAAVRRSLERWVNMHAGS